MGKFVGKKGGLAALKRTEMKTQVPPQLPPRNQAYDGAGGRRSWQGMAWRDKSEPARRRETSEQSAMTTP